ncbi:ganglioside GM2 activator [Exaiptasia diaphana]|uniref:MD-2-related lipid-recognition domain-containing protein n=1 Tax=Exaiptasia diaphana TaxID=2652724 RepID=A0A913YAD3_EXADI|nr:ganglioside GM2 activator [Exaiptasia diaphana]KXJ30124.1 Ganglioside GM2 activator [Exaiptasia diaphana]
MVWIKVAFVLVVLMVWQANALTMKNCDRRLPVQITSVNFKPDPIIVRKGRKVTFSGTLKSYRTVGSTYTLKLKVVKKGWIDVGVPCMGSFGSCEYKGLKCEQMLPYLNVPKCPPPSGSYTLKERTMVIPSVNLPSFLTSGKYYMKAEVFDEANRRRIGCVEVNFQAKS